MGKRGQWKPSWVRGVRRRYDEVRERWMIVGPERILLPKGPGGAIAAKVDGDTSVEAMVEALSEEFDGPKESIWGDTVAFLEGLERKGYLQ